MPSTSRSRGSSGGGHGSPRAPLTTPMSERQQMALVMQLTSQNNPPAATPTPGEERKRTRQQRNERGETPLHVASIRGDHDLVKKLLDQGQDPDMPDFAGWTALHEACSYGWYQVVETLVEGGANVNAKGLDDDTPLHDASTSGNLLLVQYLVEKGADPSARNTKGKTPEDYASHDIYNYLVSLKDSGARSNHAGRSRDDKKGGNGGGGDGGKRDSMDGLAADPDAGDAATDKAAADGKDESHAQVTGSTPAEETSSLGAKHSLYEDGEEPEDDGAKRRKRKENDDKDAMAKPASVQRGGTGRVLTGNKPPGPASKTGTPVKSAPGKGSGGSKGATGMKGPAKGKSSGAGKGASQSGKGDRQKSPVASPKAQNKDEDDDTKVQESNAPKVPPLKIVIPGGAGGSAEQAGEGQRGGGKGRGGSSTLPYVIPCTSADAGQGSDSSDTNSDEKRPSDSKGGRRVLRSHRSYDVDKIRSPLRQSYFRSRSRSSGQDDNVPSTSSSRSDARGQGSSVDLHPRKRKIKASKESHARDLPTKTNEAIESMAHAVQHSNPYQMYIHIRKQIDQRQRSLFPVKPKPPKDFNKYLMNRCTYTLASNVNPEPQIEFPPTLPTAMRDEFVTQEKERHRLRIQHLVEKEKLVLAVEQEILRVHGRAERAVANQPLPFSACTMLRDNEVYNVLAPEQEEKRNAQRSRCNGRQINSWLQEVDDKWERIKEGMLRRQNTEAETLHAVQKMSWEWKLKEVGLCEHKITPKIDEKHVPQIHVSNFDLPA